MKKVCTLNGDGSAGTRTGDVQVEDGDEFKGERLLHGGGRHGDRRVDDVQDDYLKWVNRIEHEHRILECSDPHQSLGK